MRIAIVNDMLLAVEAMRRVLVADGQHSVAWVARDGAEAVTRCQQDRPDLILMDLVMPEMDGVEATQRIMAQSPCGILLVTANMNESPGKVFEAMGAGALDVVATPALGRAGEGDGAAKLLTKIEAMRRIVGAPAGRNGGRPVAVTPGTTTRSHQLVVMGASAGGPAALARVLADLPPDFPAAVVIVQHVDEQFARGLAEWLGSHTPLPVRLAEDHVEPQPGTILLGGLEQHLVLTSARRLGYTRYPEDSSFHPSVDVFFKSVCQHWTGAVTGVLLTGMGRDGAEGLKRLRDRGHHTITQDEASCAVYGMPKAAVELDAAVEVLPLTRIGYRLRGIFAG